jgi:hypothetical protein
MTNPAIPEDIVRRIRRDFNEQDAPIIFQLLSEFADFKIEPRDRILRCIIFYASGDFNRFASAVKMAHQDPRDLMRAAQEDDNWDMIRDLGLPFSE